jgi:hypothetical protein
VGVAIGVDSHKHSLAAAAVDELGRVLGSGVFPNDPSGHRALLQWMKARGEPRRIGVECSGYLRRGVDALFAGLGGRGERGAGIPHPSGAQAQALPREVRSDRRGSHRPGGGH